MNLDKFYKVSNKIESDGGLQMRTPYGTVRMMYGLARALKPKVCIDVGAFVGLSAIWIARAMEENNYGTIYSIELDAKWLTMAVENVEKVGLGNRIQLIKGDSLNVLPTYDFKDKVDLVILDSGNKANYIKDFENIESKLSDNAIIFAHDIIEPEKVTFTPAWEFKKYIDKRKEYKTFLIPPEYGTLLIKSEK